MTTFLVNNTHTYFILLALLMGFPDGSDGKGSACNSGDPLNLIPGSGRSLEEGMATHSSTLALRIPWTEEAGGLQQWGHKELDTTGLFL